jgi:hypothetical protein
MFVVKTRASGNAADAAPLHMYTLRERERAENEKSKK